MVHDDLTPKEKEVLVLMAQGHDNRTIANMLVNSIDTIKWTNKNIFRKLAVENRTQATLKAQQVGLVGTPDADIPDQNLGTDSATTYLTRFIGRENAIESVCGLLQQQQLVTIVGPGGMGKTRLAIEVGHRYQQQHGTAAYFIPLVEYAEQGSVPSAIIHTLNITPSPDPVQAIVKPLTRQPLLLILDNMEHLTDDVPLLETLIKSLPDVRMLVTSRERLSLYGETIYMLEGLSLADDEYQHGSIDMNSEAVRLFIDRMQHIHANFSPQATDIACISQICKLLHGIPLAIELAAYQTFTLDLETLRHEIEQNIRILQTSMTGIDNRHRSLQAILESSWQQLSPEEQTIAMHLSVFQGGFQWDAAQEVAQANPHILTGLMNKSFIYRHTAPANRYFMHELQRQYAAQQLQQHGQPAEIIKRYIEFYRDLVTVLDPFSADVAYEATKDSTLRMQAEYTNVLIALQQALTYHHERLALEIVAAGCDFFRWQFHSFEICDYVLQAIERCENINPDTLARSYVAISSTFQDEKWGDELVQLIPHIKRPGTLGRLSMAIGSFYFSQAELERAQAYYEKAVETFSAAQLTGYNSIVLNSLGNLAEERGDYDRAMAYYKRALDQAQAVGHISSMRLVNVARLLLQANKKSAAHDYLHQLVDEASVTEYVHLYAFLWLADYLKDENLLAVAVQIVAHVDKHRRIRKRLPIPFGEKLSASLQEQLSAEVFAQYWEQGLNLTLADVVALAHETLHQIH